MFGKGSQGGSSNGAAQRRAASDVARIQGGGLSQVIVTSVTPLTFYVFLNHKAISEIDVHSLSVSIAVSDSSTADVVRATLELYAKNVTGERTLQRVELFPGTLEIIALGRRLSVTALQPDSLEGVYISVGLEPDGTDHPVTGAKELRVLVGEGLLDAKLTWMDGETEDLLPQT